MNETVCGVCGSQLGPPLELCPRCESPHHQDCWEYNGGCSVYGCVRATPGAAAQAVPAPAPAPVDARAAPSSADGDLLPAPADGDLPPGASLLWERAAPEPADVPMSIFRLLLAAGLAGVALLGTGIAPHARVLNLLLAAAFAAPSARDLVRVLAPAPVAQAQLTASPLSVEAKALFSRVGVGMPHELAQTYALFEQRHPRGRLPPEDQLRLGLELLGEGYRLLATEALSKVDGDGFRDKARAATQGLFADEPAYLFGVFPGPEPAPTPPASGFHPGLPDEGEWFVLDLTPGGLPPAERSPLTLPWTGGPGQTFLGRRLAGPMDRGAAAGLRQRLAAAGQVVEVASTAELALPAEVHEITALAFSVKQARFQTPQGEFAFGWDEVHSYFYERLESMQRSTRTTEAGASPGDPQARRWDRGAVGARSQLETEVRVTTEYQTVLEVHAGAPLRRFRIAEARPDLFHYLGRRRQLTFELNLRYAAKDLARFAPRARASRGAVQLLFERQGKGMILESLDELDEYVAWFHALGSPRLRQAWGHG